MTQSAYTPEIAAKFCAAVAEGTKSIRAICKQDGMPGKTTVFRWLADYPEFLAMYELAKDEQADTFVDEMVEIADNCKTDQDSIKKARLRIYAREVAAAKMRPRKYGNKVELTGKEGGPITVEIVRFGAPREQT